jgi:hypothetical protein
MSAEHTNKDAKDTESREKAVKNDAPQTENPVPFDLNNASITDLQRVVGNRGIQRMLAEGRLSTSPKVIQRDDDFTLGSGTGFRPRLLEGGLELDPEIEAQIRASQQLDTQLQPASIRSALSSLNLADSLRGSLICFHPISAQALSMARRVHSMHLHYQPPHRLSLRVQVPMHRAQGQSAIF